MSNGTGSDDTRLMHATNSRLVSVICELNMRNCKTKPKRRCDNDAA